MKLFNAANQQVRHWLFCADGLVTAGGAAQLVLGQSQARSHLILGNNAQEALWFEFGSARATCTISAGAVNAVSVANAGFGFSKPPVVRFLGGGTGQNGSFLGLGQPNGAAPSDVALGHCVMTGAVGSQTVSSIVIDHPGSLYACAPAVFLFNSDLDPNGCAVPAINSGLLIPSGAPPLVWNGTCCPTDAIAVWGATTGDQFTCRWMD